MNEIRIIISPDRQTVEVVIPQENGKMEVWEAITHDNIVYAVEEAAEFIQRIAREYCVTCFKNESNRENTVGMCDDCWTVELRRQRGN